MNHKKTFKETPENLINAFNLALRVYNNSYCKYSNFKVASVVKAKNSDKLFSGVNVENASFGGTICAERSAITSMITELGYSEIEYILILTKTSDTACLICQQFMTEFSGGNPIPMYLADEESVKNLHLSNIGFFLKNN